MPSLCKKWSVLHIPSILPSINKISVADGVVHNAGAKPSKYIVGGISQIGARCAANANLVKIGVVHKNTADGFASASGGHGRRVGGVVLKVVLVCAELPKSMRGLQPPCYRSDVFRVGAGKQGSKIEKGIGWLVGAVKVTATLNPNFPRVSEVIVSTASNGVSVKRPASIAAKNPEGLAVGVVLAGKDVDD